MTPLVIDQIDSAGALVLLETNVQPEKVFPSNRSTRPVGVIGSFVCAHAADVAARTRPNQAKRDRGFMRGACRPVRQSTSRKLAGGENLLHSGRMKSQGRFSSWFLIVFMVSASAVAAPAETVSTEKFAADA